MIPHSIKKQYKDISMELQRLVVFRNILDNTIIIRLQELLDEVSSHENNISKVETLYYELSYELIKRAEQKNFSGELLASYLTYILLKDENIFSKKGEMYGKGISEGLYKSANHDMQIIKKLISIDLTYIKEMLKDKSNFLGLYESIHYKNDYIYLDNIRKELAKTTNTESMVDVFIDYYQKYGSGDMGGYTFFKWNKDFVGIKNHDNITLENIIGYEYQKNILIKNTEALINGKTANNILLTGARGTGKSSCVKGVVNRYADNGLKLIEIYKSDTVDLGRIFEELEQKGKKYIIFIDDLSFEDFETDYKILKSILEGGIEKRPKNTVIYATSNRRHLIKENWNDRTGEDMHSSDSMNEKLSLSDRFGITLNFVPITQPEYLNIVEGIAKNENITIDQEYLRREAIKWEMSHNGRSGRTARQFVDFIKGTIDFE